MTARDEALALLRERFPEPWEVRVAYFGKETGPIFFGIPECQWQARVELQHPLNSDSRDNVTLYAWRESPQAAARACIAAWDEATAAERSALIAAARTIAVDGIEKMAADAAAIGTKALAAERALADRLGEALTELVRIEDLASVQCHCGGSAATCKMQRAIEALAAWRAARGKA